MIEPPPDQLQMLTRANIGDMLAAFGLERQRCGRPLLHALCWWPATRFARQVLALDRMVGEAGLVQGAAWFLAQHGAQVSVVGGEHLPLSGATLAVSNHPGMTDTLALFQALARPDLRILAARRPFLRALPNIHRQLIDIDEDASHNLAAIRATTGHLRTGGMVLTFPGGRIEPDPAHLPGADAALEGWSDSINLFARLVPQLTVLPVLVSGVLAPAALGNPLIRLRRDRLDRERMAAMLQLLVPAYHRVQVEVALGPPLRVAELMEQSGAPGSLLPAVQRAMRTLLAARIPGR